jgi:formylglycine-generating enzyme required for sulfatase activity
MSERVRVFVSHHHSPEEDAFTARLVSDLETAGADVWVDSAGIASDDFVKRISEGMAGRQWLVLVMSPAALKSPWVQREVNVALNEHSAGRMLGVLPFVMQPCSEEDIPLLWRTLQRHDAAKGYETARGRLFAALGLPTDLIAPPLNSAPSAYIAPPDRFPPRLAELGYRVAFLNGAEVIVPPVCDMPAGPFLMGSDPTKDKQAYSDEQQHWVTLGAYQIGTFPVTVAEYACFVRATGAAEPKSPLIQVTWAQQTTERIDHPAVNISWQSAYVYAQWLAERTGQPWRLPSEAEWEKAARWDSATGTARIYPWGDTFGASRCNTGEGKKGKTTPVDSYPNGASPIGAQDMVGNVWEWTGSLYGPYAFSTSAGNERWESSGQRVLRGGSWARDARLARAACRLHRAQSENRGSGFRLARSVPNT